MDTDTLRQIKALHPKPELKFRIIDILRREGEQGVNELSEKLKYRKKSSLYRYLDDLLRGGIIKKIHSQENERWVYRLHELHIQVTPKTIENHYNEFPADTTDEDEPELQKLKEILHTTNISTVDASGEKIPFSPATLMRDFLDAGVGIDEALTITQYMNQTAYNGITTKEMREKIYKIMQKKRWHVAAERYRRYIIDPIKVVLDDRIVDWNEKNLGKELRRLRKENLSITIRNGEVDRITVNAMKNLKRLGMEPIPIKFIREYLTLLLSDIQI